MTKTDAFIAAQIHPLLHPGEEVLTWAYLVPPISEGGGRLGVARTFANAATKRAVFAALTTSRLLRVSTRIGAFEPLLENLGVESIERSEIRGAALGETLLLELADGQMLEYQVNRSTAHVSAQAAFFQQIEGMLGRSEAAHALGAAKKRSKIVTTALGIALAAGYVAWRFLLH